MAATASRKYPGIGDGRAGCRTSRILEYWRPRVPSLYCREADRVTPYIYMGSGLKLSILRRVVDPCESRPLCPVRIAITAIIRHGTFSPAITRCIYQGMRSLAPVNPAHARIKINLAFELWLTLPTRSRNRANIDTPLKVAERTMTAHRDLRRHQGLKLQRTRNGGIW